MSIRHRPHSPAAFPDTSAVTRMPSWMASSRRSSASVEPALTATRPSPRSSGTTRSTWRSCWVPGRLMMSRTSILYGVFLNLLTSNILPALSSADVRFGAGVDGADDAVEVVGQRRSGLHRHPAAGPVVAVPFGGEQDPGKCG